MFVGPSRAQPRPPPYTCIYSFIYMCVYLFICVYLYIYLYIYTYIHMYCNYISKCIYLYIQPLPTWACKAHKWKGVAAHTAPWPVLTSWIFDRALQMAREFTHMWIDLGSAIYYAFWNWIYDALAGEKRSPQMSMCLTRSAQPRSREGRGPNLRGKVPEL